MQILCPQCGQVLAGNDVDAVKDVARCRQCDKVFALSSLVHGNKSGPVDPNDPFGGISQRLRVMQIVASVLLLSVAIFLAVALIVVSNRNNAPGIAPLGRFPMISVIAVVMLAVEAPLAFIIPGFWLRTALRQIASGAWQLPPGANAIEFNTDAAKLLAVRQTIMIFSLATLNGAAFFGCIAYLLEAQPFVLGAIFVAVLLMLVNFPTEGRVRSWLERQTDQLAELRQQGDIVRS